MSHLHPTLKAETYLANKGFKILSTLFVIAWLYFFLTAKDNTDWWLENILVILFFAGLFSLQRRFLFSYKSLVFIFLFLLVHIYGAQGAYTHNQFGEWLENTFHLVRNPYDRIVHFSFGFLMTFPMAEVFYRKFRRTGIEMHLAVTTAILSLATIFELIEWGVAACTTTATGETYVATQGDPWDAQKDIILALIGCVLFIFIYNIFRRSKSIVPDLGQV